ncbi:uncharacterized protein LOC105301687 [Pteropus vampyrus]|uniref:Uncharacterized protein LOC105301687 n=1 Tax=Pteropus vampyrus TaxID=132908 RepID=A0A6P6BLC6_PTEVA|nr:uncharacterized protein LOC105301687 [Pteropus vampyrus]
MSGEAFSGPARREEEPKKSSILGTGPHRCKHESPEASDSFCYSTLLLTIIYGTAGSGWAGATRDVDMCSDGTRQSAPSQAKDRDRNRTSDTKIFPGSGNKGTIRPCGQVPEDENTPKSGGLAGWLSLYLPRSFPEFSHLLFQRRSTEAAARCWFRREVTEEGTLRGEAAWSSFPEDSNSPLKTLVIDSVSENADSVLVPLRCQIDSGQGFAVFPCKKSQKCGLRHVNLKVPAVSKHNHRFLG